MTNFFYFKPLAITLHVFVALCAVPAYSQTANSNTSDTVVVSAGVLKVDTAYRKHRNPFLLLRKKSWKPAHRKNWMKHCATPQG